MKERLQSLWKALQTGAHGIRYKVRRNARHRAGVFNERHPFIGLDFCGAITLIMTMGLIVAVVVFLVWSDSQQQLRYEPDQLVFSQVVVVSLTSSIVALTSGFSTRYVYGFRLSEVVFNRPVINAITLFAPVALTLSNLALYFTKYDDALIMKLFCITLLLTIWQMVRVSEPVLAPGWVERRVQRTYYRACLRQMRKDRPLFPYGSRALASLRKSTFSLIISGDPRAEENVEMEIMLAGHLLCAGKHAYQNYLIELSNFDDPLSHLGSYAEEYLLRKRHIEGLSCLCQAYRMLSYYEVVNISCHRLMGPLYRVASSAKYLKDAQIASVYIDRAYSLFLEVAAQEDLYLSLDLSEYRIFKEGVGHAPFLPKDLLSMLFINLMENASLSDLDKERLLGDLLDRMRMLEFDNPLRRKTWSDVSGKEWFNLDYMKRGFRNSCVATQSFALLMMSLMEYGHKDYVMNFIRSNLNKTYYASLWMQCLLSLVHHLINGCHSDYLYGLKLGGAQTVEWLKLLPIKRLLHDSKDLATTYGELLRCTASGDRSGKESELYSFHPKLDYGKDPSVLITLVFETLLGEDCGGNAPDDKESDCLCVKLVLKELLGQNC